MKRCQYFSLALYEITSDTSQLRIFTRTVNEHSMAHEELVKMQSLVGGSRGSDIYASHESVVN